MCTPLNQPFRQSQPPAQDPLAPGHLSIVSLVIVAGQVEQPMQNQHLDLCRQGMSLFARLAHRGRHADSKVPGNSFVVLDQRFGRERKDICRLVLVSKLAVQAADGAVSRQQDSDLPAQIHGLLRLPQKTS
jgi:hypothetical protein